MKLALAFQLQKGHFKLACNIDINWSSPSTHVIFGQSGIGKTHLLRSLCGLEHPSGRITWQHEQHVEYWLDNQTGLAMPCHQRKVAMVFQDGQLFSHMNVEQNLRFAFDRSDATADDWTTCVNTLQIQDLLNHNVSQLSGGQAQRVALARAIISKPKLLILDEPLASLDWQSKQDVMGYIKRLNSQWQLPVLYVTHDIHEVLTLADHVIMLKRQGDSTLAMPAKPLMDILQDDRHPFYGLGKSSILHTQPSSNQHEGLLHCAIGQQTLKLPLGECHTHETQLRLCIAASDVSLALTPANDSSIMNILYGKVSRIEQTHNQQYLIQLNIEGQYLLSEISAYSFARLNIQLWQPVYAQIKGIALQQAL